MGIIHKSGEIHMVPPGRDIKALDGINTLGPKLISANMLRSWDSYPSDKWPSQWLATLSFGVRGKDGTICTVIKSLPRSFVEDVVPDDDEGQQLLEWAQQQQDLDIHLQVRTRLG
jgi:hypothetical protein